MYMNLSTFLALRNPVLNFRNILSSRALPSYKPLSYKKERVFQNPNQYGNSKREVCCYRVYGADFLHGEFQEIT